MPLTFYYASGSPYAWRVWLALEHKQVAYELKTMSFSAGELRTPEFLAINPRHRVPALVDGNFSLYESAAILEYLDEKYPNPPVASSDESIFCALNPIRGPVSQTERPGCWPFEEVVSLPGLGVKASSVAEPIR